MGIEPTDAGATTPCLGHLATATEATMDEGAKAGCGIEPPSDSDNRSRSVHLVHPGGVEPPSAGYQPTALPLSHGWGEPPGDRTQNPRVNGPALFHLSLGLVLRRRDGRNRTCGLLLPGGTVETEGIEPPSADLQSAALTTLATSPEAGPRADPPFVARGSFAGPVTTTRYSVSNEHGCNRAGRSGRAERVRGAARLQTCQRGPRARS